MKIFLIGYMGSGKSTFGPKLADAMQLPFFDLDECIEKQEGITITSFFIEKGEASFRKTEAELLRKLCSKNPSFVMSTGGGAPVHSDNMRYMNEQGVTVYLEMTPTQLAQRLAPDYKKRPLLRHLKEEELESFIKEKLKERESFYRKAQIILDGYQPDVAEVAKEILGMKRGE